MVSEHWMRRDVMTKCSQEELSAPFFRLLIILLAIIFGLACTPARSGIDRLETRESPNYASGPTPALKIAKKFKYEIPKAQRAPQFTPQTPRVQSAPTINKRSRIKRKRSSRSRRRTRASGGGGGGSCAGCRNSCYVNYRARSHSRQFVPCMRRCWYRSCRR
jgi:hypothetical protein